MDKQGKIILFTVLGLLVVGGTITGIFLHKNSKEASDIETGGSGGSTSDSNSTNDNKSSSSSSYPNDGSPFVFTNKPLLRATFAGNDIQDVNGKVVGKVTSNNQLLGVAEKVQSGFIYFVDKNANRNRIIWKGATVIDGK